MYIFIASGPLFDVCITNDVISRTLSSLKSRYDRKAVVTSFRVIMFNGAIVRPYNDSASLAGEVPPMRAPLSLLH